MSGINIDFSQTGNSAFENVYIYGLLDYDFSNDVRTFKGLTVKDKFTLEQDLLVQGESWFTGIATFADDVDIFGELDIDYLTVKQRFQIGAGGTIFVGFNTGPYSNNIGIGSTTPEWTLQINSQESSVLVSSGGTVGLGTTTPFGSWVEGNGEFSETNQGPLKLDIHGSVHVDRNIYDSVGSPGINGYWLKRDERGIRWQPTPPSVDQEGIKLQDEGEYVPVAVGLAQTFSEINFVQSNSLGLGTDTLIPTAQNPTTPTGLATVFTFDLWGFEGVGDNASIYRMTNVGILTNLPISPFQVGAGGTNSFVVTGIGSVGIATTNPTQMLQVGIGGTNTTVVTEKAWVGIGTTVPQYGLDVYRDAYFREEVTVDKHTELNETLNVDGEATFQDNVIINADDKFFKIQNNSDEDKFTVDTDNGNTVIEGTVDINNATDALDVDDGGALTVKGGTSIKKQVYIGGITRIQSAQGATSAANGALIVSGGVGIGQNLYVNEYLNVKGNSQLGDSITDSTVVAGTLNVQSSTDSTSKDTGGTILEGGMGVELSVNIGLDLGVAGITTTKNLRVAGVSTFVGVATFQDAVGIGSTLTLESHIKDINESIGVGLAQTDWRLASVGAGVSWRPSGVQTKNAIWVSVNGMDSNSGLLEGDAKRTIGAAASIAQAGDTIIVRSGVYYENNPVGLRTEVTVSGEDLRLVTVVPNNVNKDVFQVRAGCLIQNMNFAGQTSTTNHPHCGAVAFPPTAVGITGGVDFQAVTGYTNLGPANQGPDRIDPSKGARYRSPYVRNCTNFMTGSVGMKINGDYVNAAFTGVNDLGQDLKSMVCDSFTQYNENGIGVSITNNAYAQLVSIFTIGCDIAIFAGSGGQCDLTNSNSSFGNVGLKADGIGDVEFTGLTNVSSIAGQDIIPVKNVIDEAGNFRKPFDGQGAYFQINLDNYPDTPAAGILTAPLQFIRSIDILDGGTGYSPGSPPNVTIPNPQGPEAILPEFSANVSAAGTISSIDVIASGRNFLPSQELTVTFSSGNAVAKVNTDPILYTVSEATEPDELIGLSNVTFNEFIPYSIGAGVSVAFSRLSRIITSSHSFEYVGAGTDLNRANPFQGGEPIPENEVISINGGQVPFTSTDQKGNFRIGDGLTIDQTTSTISGRDFNRAIQAQLTPLILSLR